MGYEVKSLDYYVSDREEVRKLLLLAALAGRIMLRSGAETYRVEDTVERLCKSRKDIRYADAFATPTGIFISLEYRSEMMAYLIRVKSIRTDLNRINLVNEFSRKFVNSNMSIDKGIEHLRYINQINIYNRWGKSIFGSLACAFFSMLFGGVFVDFISSFMVSLIILTVISGIHRYKTPPFLSNFIGATLAAVLSILSIYLGLGKNIDIIIIGSIMSMVPGVAITNAMRDTMSGDLVSGLSRGMEAIFSALAIAFGVGMVLNIYFKGLIP
ncbi:MAG: threonine/serine exporter family protein [Tissierellia bacterium]|nr:threonine/serine exporter family protein [Tissierellia bacterium]